MYSFIVLGQIPGTSIEITFTMWLGLFVLLAGAAVFYYVHTHQTPKESKDSIDFSVAI